MTAKTITLISNQMLSHKKCIVIDEHTELKHILIMAKNKLRIAKPKILYDSHGEIVTAKFHDLEEIFVSSGEKYNGPVLNKSHADVTIICGKSDIDSIAIHELHVIAELPGVFHVWGMPDLHSGPTGCVIGTRDCLYPRFVGSDAGCGMAVFRAGKAAGFDALRFRKYISNIGQISTENIHVLKDISCLNIEKTTFDKDFGTIGGSNHFAEFQVIDAIMDSELCRQIDIDKSMLLLTVHSGSRGLGKSLSDQYGNMCLSQDEAIKDYICCHDNAVRWAKINRKAIASRILDKIVLINECVLDICHNQVVRKNAEYYHRKGAAPADAGCVVLPGSRGSHSYIIKAKNDIDLSSIGASFAHGAGRRLTRAKAEAKALKSCEGNCESLLKTAFNSLVSCGDKRILCQEIPEAYKEIDDIIEDLMPYIYVVAKLRPVLTIKSLPD